MLKFKVLYPYSGEHWGVVAHEVHSDIDLSITYTGRFGLHITGNGTVEDPYSLIFSSEIKMFHPTITIYDSDAYVQMRSLKNYNVFVNKSKNLTLFDSMYRNLWVQRSFNIKVNNLNVKRKTVLWNCENVFFEDCQIRLLYASKNNDITISNCLIKTLKTKKDDLEDPQIINTRVDKVKTTNSIPVTS